MAALTRNAGVGQGGGCESLSLVLSARFRASRNRQEGQLHNSAGSEFPSGGKICETKRQEHRSLKSQEKLEHIAFCTGNFTPFALQIIGLIPVQCLGH